MRSEHRKKRFIPKDARVAFLVELLLRGLSKNAAYPTYRLIRTPIRAPSFFTNIESNGSSSFRKAYRVHAVADAPKLFAESRKE